MSAFQILTFATQQALDTAANVMSGATMTFTLTGTSTPTNAYSDSALTTPVANPLSANAAGVFIPVFLDPLISYRVVLKTQAGAVLQTWDPANESLLSFFLAAVTQAFLGSVLWPITTAETSASTTPVNYSKFPSPWKDISRFVTDNTGATDVTTAFNNALKAEKNIIIPEGIYKITGSLIFQDNTNIEGSGYLSAIIKGDLASKSFFRSTYGETPAIGQRPVGVRIAKLGIMPLTAATITSGSVGINFRNTQYSTIEDVLMQYTDVGFVTDQLGQFLRLERAHIQVANTAIWSDATTGGNNCISDCSLGGNVVALDIDGGAWDVSKTDCTALLAGTSYCVRLGRPGGAATVVHADKLYIEGVNAANVTLQVENSVTRSRVSMHRHSTLGTIVNNAGENVVIEVPGQGFYNPLYRAQRIEFSSTIDGAALAGLRSSGGNTIDARNAANSDYAQLLVANLIGKRVAITYSASMTPDASQGYTQVITATNSTAFTINAPTNPSAVGQRMAIMIKNTSGGALGAATWNASYKMSAWTNPANGFSRSVEFSFDGSSTWTQVSQTGVDVPN